MTTVECYARINLGLLDLSDHPHRIDGSHGLYTNLPVGRVIVRATPYVDHEIHTVYKKRIYETLARCTMLKHPAISKIVVCVEQSLPGQHIGVGYGTQLSLSLVEAINQELELGLSLDQKAYLAGSGGTSGVGTYCFAHGGYNLDAGRIYPSEKGSIGPGENYTYEKLPPLLTRISVPNWPLCLAIPEHEIVVSGKTEQQLFSRYTPIPVREVDAQCKWILKGILPALITEDFSSFCLAVEHVMKTGFRAREIETYGKKQVQAMDRLRSAGLCGVGMTSFGPTLFGFAPDWNIAHNACEALQGDHLFTDVYITTPRNQGAAIAKG